MLFRSDTGDTATPGVPARGLGPGPRATNDTLARQVIAFFHKYRDLDFNILKEIFNSAPDKLITVVEFIYILLANARRDLKDFTPFRYNDVALMFCLFSYVDVTNNRAITWEQFSSFILELVSMIGVTEELSPVINPSPVILPLKINSMLYPIVRIDSSPTTHRLFISGDDAYLHGWNTLTLDNDMTVEHAHSRTTTSTIQLPWKPNYVVSTGTDSVLHVWDSYGSRVAVIVVPSPISVLAIVEHFGKLENILVGGTIDGSVIIIKQLPCNPFLKVLKVLEGHSGPITEIRSLAPEHGFISSSYDRTIRIWSHVGFNNLKKKKKRRRDKNNVSRYSSMYFSSRGRVSSKNPIFDQTSPSFSEQNSSTRYGGTDSQTSETTSEYFGDYNNFDISENNTDRFSTITPGASAQYSFATGNRFGRNYGGTGSILRKSKKMSKNRNNNDSIDEEDSEITKLKDKDLVYNKIIGSHNNSVLSISWYKFKGNDVVVSAGMDRTIRLWNMYGHSNKKDNKNDQEGPKINGFLNNGNISYTGTVRRQNNYVFPTNRLKNNTYNKTSQDKNPIMISPDSCLAVGYHESDVVSAFIVPIENVSESLKATINNSITMKKKQKKIKKRTENKKKRTKSDEALSDDNIAPSLPGWKHGDCVVLSVDAECNVHVWSLPDLKKIFTIEDKAQLGRCAGCICQDGRLFIINRRMFVYDILTNTTNSTNSNKTNAYFLAQKRKTNDIRASFSNNFINSMIYTPFRSSYIGPGADFFVIRGSRMVGYRIANKSGNILKLETKSSYREYVDNSFEQFDENDENIGDTISFYEYSNISLSNPSNILNISISSDGKLAVVLRDNWDIECMATTHQIQWGTSNILGTASNSSVITLSSDSTKEHTKRNEFLDDGTQKQNTFQNNTTQKKQSEIKSLSIPPSNFVCVINDSPYIFWIPMKKTSGLHFSNKGKNIETIEKKDHLEKEEKIVDALKTTTKKNNNGDINTENEISVSVDQNENSGELNNYLINGPNTSNISKIFPLSKNRSKNEYDEKKQNNSNEIGVKSNQATTNPEIEALKDIEKDKQVQKLNVTHYYRIMSLLESNNVKEISKVMLPERAISGLLTKNEKFVILVFENMIRCYNIKGIQISSVVFDGSEKRIKNKIFCVHEFLVRIKKKQENWQTRLSGSSNYDISTSSISMQNKSDKNDNIDTFNRNLNSTNNIGDNENNNRININTQDAENHSDYEDEYTTSKGFKTQKESQNIHKNKEEYRVLSFLLICLEYGFVVLSLPTLRIYGVYVNIDFKKETKSANSEVLDKGKRERIDTRSLSGGVFSEEQEYQELSEDKKSSGRFVSPSLIFDQKGQNSFKLRNGRFINSTPLGPINDKPDEQGTLQNDQIIGVASDHSVNQGIKLNKGGNYNNIKVENNDNNYLSNKPGELSLEISKNENLGSAKHVLSGKDKKGSSGGFGDVQEEYKRSSRMRQYESMNSNQSSVSFSRRSTLNTMRTNSEKTTTTYRMPLRERIISSLFNQSRPFPSVNSCCVSISYMPDNDKKDLEGERVFGQMFFEEEDVISKGIFTISCDNGCAYWWDMTDELNRIVKEEEMYLLFKRSSNVYNTVYTNTPESSPLTNLSSQSRVVPQQTPVLAQGSKELKGISNSPGITSSVIKNPFGKIIVNYSNAIQIDEDGNVGYVGSMGKDNNNVNKQLDNRRNVVQDGHIDTHTQFVKSVSVPLSSVNLPFYLLGEKTKSQNDVIAIIELPKPTIFVPQDKTEFTKISCMCTIEHQVAEEPSSLPPTELFWVESTQTNTKIVYGDPSHSKLLRLTTGDSYGAEELYFPGCYPHDLIDAQLQRTRQLFNCEYRQIKRDNKSKKESEYLKNTQLLANEDEEDGKGGQTSSMTIDYPELTNLPIVIPSYEISDQRNFNITDKLIRLSLSGNRLFREFIVPPSVLLFMENPKLEDDGFHQTGDDKLMSMKERLELIKSIKDGSEGKIYTYKQFVNSDMHGRIKDYIRNMRRSAKYPQPRLTKFSIINKDTIASPLRENNVDSRDYPLGKTLEDIPNDFENDETNPVSDGLPNSLTSPHKKPDEGLHLNDLPFFTNISVMHREISNNIRTTKFNYINNLTKKLTDENLALYDLIDKIDTKKFKSSKIHKKMGNRWR